jgi:hypothetical protein
MAWRTSLLCIGFDLPTGRSKAEAQAARSFRRRSHPPHHDAPSATPVNATESFQENRGCVHCADW